MAQNDTLGHERNITLSEAIVLARTQSVDAAVALNELKTAYWEYRTFRADLLPEVNFTGTLPNYNKSYSTYQNSDGSYSFVRNNTLGLSGQLSVDQNIWFTGGKLSLTSSLDYLKQLGSGGAKQFMSVPVSLELTQPVFGVNTLKWNRRIEPVRYAEAKAEFISATEEVTMKTITYFFELLLAKESLATAMQNKTNADRLYEVAIAKRKMGQISENDLLQLKLNSLQGKADVTEAESNLNAKMFQLRSFLGVSEQESLNPVLPATVPDIKMEYDRVLNKALERNSFAQNIRRRQLEADYEVATARGNLRSIDLFASVGYTGQNHEFSSAYRDLLDNQIVQVGVKIPILDWGKRRGKVTSVDKRNVLETSRMWREIVHRVHDEEYADVELEDLLVDNTAMQLINRPADFDVVVTENMFGDILSDEAAQITGSLGMLASASLGDGVSLFEPSAGSAPDIAGQGIANPLAQILSVAMMLTYAFDMTKEAAWIEAAVERVLNEGWRTRDIADSDTPAEKIIGTADMGDKVIAAL